MYSIGKTQYRAFRNSKLKNNKDIEKILLEVPEVEFVTTATGYSILSGAMISNTGFLFVSMNNWADRDRTADEVILDLNKKLAEWQNFYNFVRPHSAHQGNTLYEALRSKLI